MKTLNVPLNPLNRHTFYITHQFEKKVRKVFWITLSPDKNDGKGAYVSVGAIDKNFVHINKHGKEIGLHATFHDNVRYHITTDKGGPICSAITGGLDLIDTEEPWLEFTSNPINTLPIEKNAFLQNHWNITSKSEAISIFLKIDRVAKIDFDSLHPDKFIAWGKVILRISIFEIPPAKADVQMLHSC
ncbi:MAG: hypothetical protein EBR02_07070 [Alphaproteobacteria bacterium]|nr:hypothetical protein [Alphaproteobacteria bacterium]